MLLLLRTGAWSLQGVEKCDSGGYLSPVGPECSIVDTVVAIVRRKLSGRPAMEADKMHLHHRLLAMALLIVSGSSGSCHRHPFH